MLMKELRSEVGLRVIQDTALTSKPVALASPIRRESIWFKGEGSVSVRCYLAPSADAELRMFYCSKQSNWQIEHRSEVIEFSGRDFDGGTVLRTGRFYFQNDMLIEDSIWPKRKQFLDWADKLFRVTKSKLHRSNALDAYVGDGAEEFRRQGGRLRLIS
jgi:hypothetical protein